MKATMSERGVITLQAETSVEAYALRRWSDEAIINRENIELAEHCTWRGSRLLARAIQRLPIFRATPPSPSTAPTVEVDELPPLPTQHAPMTGWTLTEAYQQGWKDRASKPPAREAAERLSIEDDGRFQCLLWHYVHARDKLSNGKFTEAEATLAFRELIAHINTWGGAAPAAGNTAQTAGKEE